MTASELRKKKSDQKRSFTTALSVAPVPPNGLKQKMLSLSPEQKHVLEIVVGEKGQSVFFTGSAGQFRPKSALCIARDLESYSIPASCDFSAMLVLMV
jgi:hypothetical protein